MTPLWVALLPHAPPCSTEAAAPGAAAVVHLHGLALWALQFTPRVACVPSSSVWGDALVLELAASERLFGGRQALARRLLRESRLQGVQRISWAPTSLAAIALARCGLRHGFGAPLAQVLAPLPLSALDAVAAHAELLAPLGCDNLGAVQALPRSGVARRFGAGLLQALDSACGLRSDSHSWLSLPPRFDARLELPFRIDHAEGLLHGARQLLLQLCGWLAAQRAGIRSCTLRWCHDAMRSKHAGDGGELVLHTASTTRNHQHLSRLLQEHLAHVQLLAPVGELSLHADAPEPLAESSASLLPEAGASSESLALVLERISARLGMHQVQRPLLQPDHRPEWQVQWQPANSAACASAPAVPPLPQPSFLLAEPLRLLQDGNSQPLYQGPLQLLLGPQRLEGGWWHRSPGFLAGDAAARVPPGAQTAHTAVRDYWVAHNAQAGLLWIFHTRLAAQGGAWFLHGKFA